MRDSIFIISQNNGAKKIVVALGLLSILRGFYQKIAIFKPIFAPSIKDKELETLVEYFHLDQSLKDMQAIPLEMAEAILLKEGLEALIEEIKVYYQNIKENFDFVLLLSDDSSKLNSLAGVDVNLEIAKALNCSVVGVFLAQEMNQNELIENAKSWEKSIKTKGVRVDLLFANYCSLPTYKQLKKLNVKWLETPLFFIPFSEELSRLSLADILEHLPVEQIAGEGLEYEISTFKVGAMGLERLIKSFKPYEFLITSTDRLDLLLGVITSSNSISTPPPGGVLVCGEALSHNLLNLLAGLEEICIPILYTNWHEHELIPETVQIKPTIRVENRKKIATAFRLFWENTDENEILEQLEISKERLKDSISFKLEIDKKATLLKRTLLISDSENEKILLAVEILRRKGIDGIKLVGVGNKIFRKAKKLGIELDEVEVLDIFDEIKIREYAKILYQLRPDEALSLKNASDLLRTNKTLFSIIALYAGEGDGIVFGPNDSFLDILEFLSILRKKEIKKLSSFLTVLTPRNPIFFADYKIYKNPSSKDLAIVANESAKNLLELGITPKIAMVTYPKSALIKDSNFEKLKDATKILKELNPTLDILGPIEYPKIIEKSLLQKDSLELDSRNLFIFPDFESAQLAHEALPEEFKISSFGTIIQGANKIAGIIEKENSVDEIVDTLVSLKILTKRG
jgi:phosphate acetyltransferase